MNKRLLAAIFLLAFPIASHAGTAWEVYGYANGEVLRMIFEGVKSWMGSNSFLYMAESLAIIGMLGMAWMGDQTPSKALKYALGLTVGVYLLFSAKVDVLVIDTVHQPGHVIAPILVEDVPAAAALPISVISQFGQDIANGIETAFVNIGATSNVPTMSSGTPFGGAYGIMKDLSSNKIRNPIVRQNVTEFLRYCLVPYLGTRFFDVQDLTSKPNFWQAVGENSWQAVNQYVPVQKRTALGNNADENILAPCRDIEKGEADEAGIQPEIGAWTLINEQIKLIVPEMLGRIAGSGAWLADGSNYSAIVGEWATGASEGSANLALNSAMMELNRGAFGQAATALNADSIMIALNTENARRAQKSGWYTTSVLFRDMAGYFFSILQCFVIALVPLVALMAFLPGIGMKMVGGFIKVILWLTLWWPGLAVVNFIMLGYYTSQITSAGSACIGDVAGCVQSLGLVNGFTENMMIASGLMATFVPAIMWGIVSQGSFALTSVLDRASGSGYATQAGESIASGSAKFGDVSMGNSNLHKHDSSWRNSSGIAATQNFSGAAQTVNNQEAGGNTASIAGKAASINYDHKKMAGYSEQHRETQQLSESYGEDYKQDLTARMAKMEALKAQYATTQNGQTSWNNQEQYQQYQKLEKQQQEQDQFALEHGVSKEGMENTKHEVRDAVTQKIQGSISSGNLVIPGVSALKGAADAATEVAEGIGAGKIGGLNVDASVSKEHTEADTKGTSNSSKGTEGTRVAKTKSNGKAEAKGAQGSKASGKTTSGTDAASVNKDYMDQLTKAQEAAYAKSLATAKKLDESQAKEAALKKEVQDSVSVSAGSGIDMNQALAMIFNTPSNIDKTSGDLADKNKQLGDDANKLKNEVKPVKQAAQAATAPANKITELTPEQIKAQKEAAKNLVAANTGTAQASFNGDKTEMNQASRLEAENNNKQRLKDITQLAGDLGLINKGDDASYLNVSSESLEKLAQGFSEERDYANLGKLNMLQNDLKNLNSITENGQAYRLVGVTGDGEPLYAQGETASGKDALVHANRSAIDPDSGHLRTSSFTPYQIDNNGNMQEANWNDLNKNHIAYLNNSVTENLGSTDVSGTGGGPMPQTGKATDLKSREQGYIPPKKGD